jgi:hypothetical protein
MSEEKKKNCPRGTRKNPKTGVCEPIKTDIIDDLWRSNIAAQGIFLKKQNY